MQSLFREAEIHNAVLFFDECESMFSQRSQGGSSQMTMLLTEIERHTGIIFLATNRPFDLDEAMHRRITASFEFKPPNHMERAAIWRIHTAEAGVPIRDDIDWEEIAVRYELAGGSVNHARHSAVFSNLLNIRLTFMVTTRKVHKKRGIECLALGNLTGWSGATECLPGGYREGLCRTDSRNVTNEIVSRS